MTDALKLKYSNLGPWFGSDAMIAPDIARELDGCDWVGIPCVGGAAIVPHLTARSILAGDVHRHMMNMARVVRDPALGPKLYRTVRSLPLHPDVLAEAQAACVAREARADVPPVPDLAWAVDYFTCCWMGQGGRAGRKDEFKGGLSFRWNANGGSSIARWTGAAGDLRAWRRTLARCEFVTLDIFDFLVTVREKATADQAKAPAKRARRGVYLDPPWVDAGDVYAHPFTEAHHRRLAAELDATPGTVLVVRYGDHPLVRELYTPDRWRVTERVSRTQGNNPCRELLMVRDAAAAASLAA